MMNVKRHVFIIGAKSLLHYGGYETFVDKLTEQHAAEESLQYHIACKANGYGFMDETKLTGVKITKRNQKGAVTEFTYHNAHIFKISCPNIGPAMALYYDKAALQYSIDYCKEHKIDKPIFYVLTCRIGLFITGLKRQIRSLGGEFYLNPDGHEWKRAKWPAPVRWYWKWSEKKMVREADLVVCDSMNIEKYIREEYNHPNTVFIAYGSDILPSGLSDSDPKFTGWMKEKGIKAGEYYLAVGRFVPENNYETMIREFMRSSASRDFVIITDENDKLKEKLEEKLHCTSDPRIKFAGPVYDQELLKKIRENAYAYLHGHEVGGTNPSLLEALGATDLNLLYDVGFNREVGLDAALYWTKEQDDLKQVLETAEQMDPEQRKRYGLKAKERIRKVYNWETIGRQYKEIFR